MTKAKTWLLMATAALMPLATQAKDDPGSSPQAGARTHAHAQNYKDMVLATCIANAYREDKGAAIDAGSSVSALRGWIQYDMDKAPDEIKGVRFDLLKCLDLYHSKELEAQVKRLVIQPKRTYRQQQRKP